MFRALKALILSGLISLIPISIFSTDNQSFSDQKNKITNFVNESSMTFTENKGQWDESVLFRSDANGATMWFTKDGAFYQFTRRIDNGISKTDPSFYKLNQDKIKYESIMIKASFVGANPYPQMSGVTRLNHDNNYFIGNDPDKWYTDVPNYSAVVYEDVYPGINLKYYGNGKQMEYDFIVSPGADPSQIEVQYEGAKSISVDSQGRLIVETEWGFVTEKQPVIYQNIDGQRNFVSGEYTLKEDNSFGFEFTQDYDRNLPIVIDPVLSFSTYLGGSADETCFDIAVDKNSSPYIVGYTSSGDYPTQNPYQADTASSTDIFVTKFSSDGSTLEYSTFLGGTLSDNGLCIAVDTAGNAYISGRTYSTDFPTKNAFQAAYGGGIMDAFLTKIGSAGNTLEYSTYLGGSLDDDCFDIAVDDRSNAYLTGRTKSTNFPTSNAFQATYAGGVYDGFITKFDSASNTVAYSTYFGGAGWEYLNGIAVDNSDNVVVVGGTASTLDYPLKNAYQAAFGGGNYDICLTKLGADGDTLI